MMHSYDNDRPLHCSLPGNSGSPNLGQEFLQALATVVDPCMHPCCNGSTIQTEELALATSKLTEEVDEEDWNYKA